MTHAPLHRTEGGRQLPASAPESATPLDEPDDDPLDELDAEPLEDPEEDPLDELDAEPLDDPGDDPLDDPPDDPLDDPEPDPNPSLDPDSAPESPLEPGAGEDPSDDEPLAAWLSPFVSTMTEHPKAAKSPPSEMQKPNPNHGARRFRRANEGDFTTHQPSVTPRNRHTVRSGSRRGRR